MKKEYKNYDRGHRYDKGAIQAISRGEKPQSYWTKASILADLLLVIDHSDNILAKIYRKYETDKTEVKQAVKKLSRKILMHHALKWTGTHKTGNYYMNTSYYRVLVSEELPEFIERFAVHRKQVFQLKLNLI